VRAEEPISGDPPLMPVKISWLMFFGVLLAPPLLTLLVAYVTRGQSNQPISPLIALFGGAAAGIGCGIMLALRLGKTLAARVVVGILFSVVFAVVCIMLSFGGCMIGGYELFNERFIHSFHA
jgi:hypothetical protein